MTDTGERLRGKRCIVTGGGSGIGRAVALRFAAESARVVVNGRREDALNDVAALDDDIAVFAGDLTEPETARRLVQHTIASLGGLDVLFHGAGVLRRNEHLDETTDDQWGADIATNLTGAFDVVRAAIPSLRAHEGS